MESDKKIEILKAFQENNIIIYGNSGTGKTSLIYSLCMTYCNSRILILTFNRSNMLTIKNQLLCLSITNSVVMTLHSSKKIFYENDKLKDFTFSYNFPPTKLCNENKKYDFLIIDDYHNISKEMAKYILQLKNDILQGYICLLIDNYYGNIFNFINTEYKIFHLKFNLRNIDEIIEQIEFESIDKIIENINFEEFYDHEIGIITTNPVFISKLKLLDHEIYSSTFEKENNKINRGIHIDKLSKFSGIEKKLIIIYPYNECIKNDIDRYKAISRASKKIVIYN